MGLFGGSLESKVKEALKQVAAKVSGVRDLDAAIEGKTVTLRGIAGSREQKAEAMRAFTELVGAETIVNGMTLEPMKAAPAPAATAAPGASPGVAAAKAAAPAPAASAAPKAERIHVVEKGETLGAIAKAYYGKAGAYTRIFEANKDVLKDPDKISIGQKLRIPE